MGKILAGAPGAGKGFILRGLDLSGLTTYNLDLDFVPLLKKAGVTLDLKNATPEERSQAAKLMRQAASKLKDEDLPKAIANRESFILDGTAASSKATLKLKDELEKAGYEVFMLYVYTDLERSLKQNQDRFDKSGGEDRSLAPAIVMRTWNSVTQNYDEYKNAFGDNFVSVSNLLKDEKLEDLESIVKKYLDPFKPPIGGHFEVVKEALKQYPEIDELIILVGSGERNGISQAEAILIWEIYQDYLSPKVKNLFFLLN